MRVACIHSFVVIIVEEVTSPIIRSGAGWSPTAARHVLVADTTSRPFVKSESPSAVSDKDKAIDTLPESCDHANIPSIEQPAWDPVFPVLLYWLVGLIWCFFSWTIRKKAATLSDALHMVIIVSYRYITLNTRLSHRWHASEHAKYCSSDNKPGTTTTCQVVSTID